jgi:hypothetical protein
MEQVVVISVCSAYRVLYQLSRQICFQISERLPDAVTEAPIKPNSISIFCKKMLPKSRCWLLGVCAVSQILVCIAEKEFKLDSRWPVASEKDPNLAVWRVRSGAKTVFKCTSSEKFHMVNPSNKSRHLFRD